ncbi:MAG TPA: transporter substrate-binding domain-containing protein [Roseateles sp.]
MTCRPHSPRRRWMRALAAMLGLAALAAQARPMSACGQAGTGPPWLYRAPAQPQQLTGFVVDLWAPLFAGLGVELKLHDLPFKRCLQAVADGEIDFALAAYRDEARERTLAFSAPYKTFTPQVFYRANRPLQLTRRADLKRWRGCGKSGASYLHYGLAPGDLDQGARSYAQLIDKLMLGRCDYFVEELETIALLDLGRVNHLATPGLAHAPVPDAKAPAFHVVAAKGSAAAGLLPRLDAALADARRRGDLARHWRRHAGNLPY